MSPPSHTTKRSFYRHRKVSRSVLSKNRLGQLRGFLVDMDGVLYKGKYIIKGAKEALCRLRTYGKVLMVTNNSRQQPIPLARRLGGLGFKVSAGDILVISEIVESWLLRNCRNMALLLIAEPHLHRRLRRAGFKIVPPEHWRDAKAVVVACHTKITHSHLVAAVNALSGGAAFITTNPDRTVNGDDGLDIEAGAYSDLLASCSGRSPIVIGKPQRICFDYALEKLGLESSQVAMIGDNLETDIRGARENGLFGVLVLSGLTARASDLADLTVTDIGAFADCVTKAHRATEQ